MATASDNPDLNITLMEGELSCNICYNLLREPKDLDCPHMFCLQCLQQWAKKGNTVECPECRHITVVPKGGLANLKTNLRLKAMVEKYAERVEKQKGVPICPNHEGEKQHFFCVTCGVTVCHNCLVLEHERPQHEIKELKDVTKSRKAELKVKVNRVQEEVKQTKEDQKQLHVLKRKLQEAKEKANRDIEKQSQSIYAKVDATKTEMKACVEATFQCQMKALHEKEDHAKDRVMRLENIDTATGNVVDKAADHIYVKQHALLVDKIAKLCINEHKAISPDLGDLGSLSFNPGPDPVDPSWFGNAMMHNSRICRLKLVNEFGAFQRARGVAVTQTGLLVVVDSRARKVIVYRDVNGNFKRQFCLDSSADGPHGKVMHPFDVAVTSGGNFFVTNDECKCMVFSPGGRYEKTLTNNIAGFITTTPDDAIVSGVGAIIHVRQPDGKLIRKFHVDCEHIWGIASNGKQIAFTAAKKGHSVHVIDFVTGQPVWKVNMVYPLGICYEPNTNTLLVAGGSLKSGQCVIEQYCSTTGLRISRLASGLIGPCAMTVTQDNKLVVADLKTIKVFSIQ